MADNPKPTTISDSPENATDPRATRTRRIIALANLALMPILGALFLALVCKRRLEPVYSLISDTPLAVTGEKLANLFGQQAIRLAADLKVQQRADAEALVARMAARMPTHAAVRHNGAVVFGQLSDRDADRLELGAVDGRLHQSEFIPNSDLRLLKPLVHPEVELQSRDARFLLQHPTLRHFCLSPLLVATDGGYAAAHDVYLSLSLLEDAFVKDFASVIEGEAGHNRLLHVVVTDEPLAAHSVQDTHHAGNANAWYDPDRDVLVVARGDRPDRAAYLRHEGCHELCRRYNLLGDYTASPLWLREGLAQYCETTPFGRVSAVRGLILSRNRVPWEALLEPLALEHIEDEADRAAFYAQSWFLVSWLMSEPHRTRFFRYLVDNRQSPQKLRQLIPLLNALDVTTAQLEADFNAFVVAPESPTEKSP